MKAKRIVEKYYQKRKEANMTIHQMASSLGVCDETYRKIENGQTTVIHPLYEKINRVLNLTDLDFVNEDGIDYQRTSEEIRLLKEQIRKQKREIEYRDSIIRSKETQLKRTMEMLDLSRLGIDKMREIVTEKEKEIRILSEEKSIGELKV